MRMDTDWMTWILTAVDSVRCRMATRLPIMFFSQKNLHRDGDTHTHSIAAKGAAQAKARRDKA